jgi:hypothetical protein
MSTHVNKGVVGGSPQLRKRSPVFCNGMVCAAPTSIQRVFGRVVASVAPPNAEIMLFGKRFTFS